MEFKINIKAIDNVSNTLDRIKGKFDRVSAEGQSKLSRVFEAPRRKITSIFGGGFPKRGGGGEGDEGEGGGLTGIFGKGAGGMLGKFAALTIVVEGIYKLIKTAVGFLIEASPLLRGVLKILRFGILMILKPIGDIIAMALLPLAKFFIQFMRPYQERLAKAQASGDTGEVFNIWVEMVTGLMGELWDGFVSAIQSIDWLDALKGAGEFLYNLVTGWFTWLNDLFFGVIQWLGQQIYNGLAGLGGMLVNVVDSLMRGLVTTLAEFELPIFGKIFKGILQDWFPQYFEGESELISTALNLNYDELRSIDEKLQILNEQTQEEMNIWKELQGWFRGRGGTPPITAMASGGIVTKPTIGLIGEAGPEAVIPLNRAMTAMGNVEVHIHGNVFGVTDLQRVVEDSIDEYAMKLRLL